MSWFIPTSWYMSEAKKPAQRSSAENVLEVLPEMCQGLFQGCWTLFGLGQDYCALNDRGQMLGQALGAPAGARRVLRLRLVEVLPEALGGVSETGRAHRANRRVSSGQLLDECAQQTALGPLRTARQADEELDAAEDPVQGILLLVKRSRLEHLLHGGVETFRDHPSQVLLAFK